MRVASRQRKVLTVGRPKDGKRYFEEIQQCLEKHGGFMWWDPQPPGGWWVMELENRTARVRYNGQDESEFDGLYVEEEGGGCVYPYELIEDAFWRLVDVFRKQA